MDFYEVEGKRILAEAGIPTDAGRLLDKDTDFSALSYPCVLKAQVLSGKRGKAGGIRIARSPEEAARQYGEIAAMTINGRAVSGVLAVPAAGIAAEHYIGLTIDRRQRSVVLLYSPCGGMDIEEVAEHQPDQLLALPVGECFDAGGFLRALERFPLAAEDRQILAETGEKLFQAFVRLDATTLEINPYARLKGGGFAALDAKLVLDDNALYRQGDYTLLPRAGAEGPGEEAARYGLSFVELDPAGGIGLIAGGAGIGMATVDAIRYYGGSPYNFMDLGGGVTEEKMYHAVRLLLRDEKADSILINVFGGINNCRIMAEGTCRALREFPADKPVVVKSRGFSQEEGWALYDQLGLSQVRYGTTDDAVRLLLDRRKGARA